MSNDLSNPAASGTNKQKQQKRPNCCTRRELQRPISQQHYEEVLQAFEAPFAKDRLQEIQAQLLARSLVKDPPMDTVSLQAKVFMGQELKTREIHLSKPLRPTETQVKGVLPTAEDVLNEKRAWLEADSRRYWDFRNTSELPKPK